MTVPLHGVFTVFSVGTSPYSCHLFHFRWVGGRGRALSETMAEPLHRVFAVFFGWYCPLHCWVGGRRRALSETTTGRCTVFSSFFRLVLPPAIATFPLGR